MKNKLFLKVKNLSCERNYLKIFSNIDFNLYSGNTLIVKGMNGSGKTSLLLSIAGILPVTGKIIWNNNISKIGYVGHKNAIKPNETVNEFLKFWKSLLKSNNEIKKILLDFRLHHLEDLQCNLLSFGQKKVLSFIRLLLLNSNVWLLDEPLSGLDKINQKLIINLMKYHNQNGGAIIITTHDDHQIKNKVKCKELVID